MSTPEFDRESNPELRRLLADYKDSITPSEQVFQSNLRRVRVRIRTELNESDAKKSIGQLIWRCLSRRMILTGFVGVATVVLLMIVVGDNGRMLARPSVWVQELSNLSQLHLGDTDRFEGVQSSRHNRSQFLSSAARGSAATGGAMKGQRPIDPALGMSAPEQGNFPPMVQSSSTLLDKKDAFDESQEQMGAVQKNENLAKRKLRAKRKKNASRKPVDAEKLTDKSGLGEILAEAASLRAVNRLVRKKKFSSASEKIDAHLRQYASGKLREEAMALRIDISCLQGKSERSKKLTQRFLREFPSSAFAMRLSQGCKATGSDSMIRDVAKD